VLGEVLIELNKSTKRKNMTEEIMRFLPLIFMMVFFFLINKWVGMACGVWTTKEKIISLIPGLNYFGPLFILIASIDRLNKRVEQLEATGKSGVKLESN
jgi:F0F1-type ATP synthase membrane subunit a